MNPNRGGEQAAAQFESLPAESEQYNKGEETSAEKPVTSPESSPTRQAAPLLPTVIPTAAPPADPAQLVSAQDDSMAQPALPAADSDRIEKQWVDRAKTVIAQTRDDPFLQNNEMSKVKAAYIEKRFNKRLKVDDAKA